MKQRILGENWVFQLVPCRPRQSFLRKNIVRTKAASTVLMKYLVEERYLFPFFDGKTGKELTDYVRGLTPKGLAEGYGSYKLRGMFGLKIIGSRSLLLELQR